MEGFVAFFGPVLKVASNARVETSRKAVASGESVLSDPKVWSPVAELCFFLISVECYKETLFFKSIWVNFARQTIPRHAAVSKLASNFAITSLRSSWWQRWPVLNFFPLSSCDWALSIFLSSIRFSLLIFHPASVPFRILLQSAMLGGRLAALLMNLAAVLAPRLWSLLKY